MHKAKTIPTVFAIAIAESADLMPRGLDTLASEDDFTIKNPEQRLIAFQQIGICGTYEEALLAYHGVTLKDFQDTALRLIYDSTIPWLTGHVISELIDNAGTKSAAEFILTQLIKDGKVDSSTAQELLVRMKVIDPKKTITKHEDKDDGQQDAESSSE